MITDDRIFLCPACHAPLEFQCQGDRSACTCGFQWQTADGVPVLIADLGATQRLINEALDSDRGTWYRASQAGLWQGPYRHHLRKRQAFVEDILGRFANERRCLGRGLDLGCGDGLNTMWLSRFFQRTYASDYNLVRLARARERVPQTCLFLADINNYPIRDDAFDVVFFNHVLEHIPDDLGALRQVYRILAPGGLLVLGIPNEGAQFWQWAYKRQPRMLATSDHVHFYTAETAADRCREAGFSIEGVHPIGWGVPHWTLDALIRRFKWVDDLLESLGKRFLPDQATSLYLLLRK